MREEPAIIKTLRLGVKNHQMVSYHKQKFDMQTANCLLTVYDSFKKKESKEKFVRMAENNLPKLIDFCWSRMA